MGLKRELEELKLQKLKRAKEELGGESEEKMQMENEEEKIRTKREVEESKKKQLEEEARAKEGILRLY